MQKSSMWSAKSVQMAGFILLGLIFFAAYLLQDQGLIQLLLEGDRSRLSYLILTIWLIMTVRWLWLLNWIEQHASETISLATGSTEATETTEMNMARWLNHGWFSADLCLKIGLLGTIIGFILMLTPIRDLTSFDPVSLQSALKAMSGGMAIALYTTLTGLVCHLLLRVQFQLASDAMHKLLTKVSSS